MKHRHNAYIALGLQDVLNRVWVHHCIRSIIIVNHMFSHGCIQAVGQSQSSIRCLASLYAVCRLSITVVNQAFNNQCLQSVVCQSHSSIRHLTILQISLKNNVSDYIRNYISHYICDYICHYICNNICHYICNNFSNDLTDNDIANDSGR